jgi:fumarylacetoacetase
MKSWVNVPLGSDFTIYNIPFGVCGFLMHLTTSTFGPFETKKACVTIVGDTVIDLSTLEEAGAFDQVEGLRSNVFNQPTLNEFLRHPKYVWLGVRSCLIDILQENPSNNILMSNPELQKAVFYDLCNVELQLPIKIGDYTDFYASREHATNVGTMFRGATNALNDNWLHLPVGYHGRSSTVVCSGTPVRRPCGQIQKDPIIPVSTHGPCEKLDFELEIAAVIGGESNCNPMTIEEAKDRLFGYVLMNDWSARDIQKWEYVPLGPFTSKNFATTISPWIVMTAALEGYIGGGSDNKSPYSFAAKTSSVEQTNPIPLPYLRDPNYSSYDVRLFVSIAPSTASNNTIEKNTPQIICHSNFRNMYWNAAQQLAHHSVTGCVMNPGDLIGSGTISGRKADSYGSLLELSSNGLKDVHIGDGQTRRFLMDGDTVLIRGFCEKEAEGIRIGFGECVGNILPSLPLVSSHAENTKTEVSRSRFVDFVLYGYCRSSCTWCIRTAMASKRIEYRTIPIDLEKSEHNTIEYIEKVKLGQVPLLEWTDQITGRRHKLSQSIAIIALLDDSFPDRRSLIPKDPIAKACALEVVEIINVGIQSQQNTFFLQDVVHTVVGESELILEVAKSNIHIVLEVVVSLLQQYHDNNPNSKGPFALGTFSPTIVDACLVPQLYNARRMNVPMVNFSSLVKVELKCMEHPWFMQSHPDNQPGAASKTKASH